MKFETGCELIDATSISRPDLDWSVVDAAGHEHRWAIHGHGGHPGVYRADRRYWVESLTWVWDGVEVDEDGEEHAVGHHECRVCGAIVSPGYTADATTQYVAGLRWFKVDGRRVTAEEFQEAARRKGMSV